MLRINQGLIFYKKYFLNQEQLLKMAYLEKDNFIFFLNRKTKTTRLINMNLTKKL